jgi:hypothetical protein
MDETAVYLDFPSSCTCETTGSQSVPGYTTGMERVRLSAAFCASADGRKLPLLIIIPRATELLNFTPPDNVVLLYKTGARFNSEIITDAFLNRVLVPHVNRYDLQNTTLFLDSAPCHVKKPVDEAFASAGIGKKMIPSHFTNLLQPQKNGPTCTLMTKNHSRNSLICVLLVTQI